MRAFAHGGHRRWADAQEGSFDDIASGRRGGAMNIGSVEREHARAMVDAAWDSANTQIERLLARVAELEAALKDIESHTLNCGECMRGRLSHVHAEWLVWFIQRTANAMFRKV